MPDDESLDLKPGNFLYQSDSELFLVCASEGDDSYLFSVHGWRHIGKDRVAEYVDGESAKLYTQDEIDTIMQESDDDDAVRHYNELLEMFEEYAAELREEGPHTEFSLRDT